MTNGTALRPLGLLHFAFVWLVVSAAPALAQAGGPIATCTATGPAEEPIASAPAATPEASVTLVGDLTVLAAASLRGALEAMAPAYLAQTGVTLEYEFDASSALRARIEEGAPADVFTSADTVHPQALVDAGLTLGDAVAFTCNQLTVIVPHDNPAAVTSAADLARPGVRVITAGDEVPITRYALQLAENLGIAEAYSANIASREDNVAAVRAKIELGEGDAAVVYVTDAIASGDQVLQIPVPPESNVPATYAAVVLAASDQPAESQAFIDWLVGPEGQASLISFGFLPAP